MELIKRADFEQWAEDNNWLKVGEGGSAIGHQNTYLSPTGEIVIVQYNLNSELHTVGKLIPTQGPSQPPFLNPGGPFPGGGKPFPA